MIKNRSFFKVVALLVLISFSSAQPAFARGRRGGNSGGDLAVAFAGGVAMPLGAVAGAYIGAEMGLGVYNGLLSSSAYGMAAGNVATAGMTAAGANPNTTRWVSAGASGLAGGLSSVNSANLTGSAATAQVGKSMISSLVSSEAAYQFSEAGVPLSGALGSIAGSFAGGFTQGMLSSEGGFGQSLADGFSQGAKYAIGGNGDGHIGSSIGYAVASDLVSDALVGMVDERSLARPYAGYVGGLGGRVAGHFAGTTISGAPNMLDDDFYKRGSWKGDWHKESTSYNEYMDTSGRGEYGQGYGPVSQDWYESNIENRWVRDGNVRTTHSSKIYSPKGNTVEFIKPLDFTNASNWLENPVGAYTIKEFDFDTYRSTQEVKGYDFRDVGDGKIAEYAPYGEYLIGSGNPMQTVLPNIPTGLNPAPLGSPVGYPKIN